MMAALLHGCCNCDTGFFEDKNGHELVATCVAEGCGGSGPAFACKTKDGQKHADGFVYEYEKFTYKPGKGESSTPLTCEEGSWVYENKKEENFGRLKGECKSQGKKKYDLCSEDTCKSKYSSCEVLKPGVKGKPLKRNRSGCCKKDKECEKKEEKAKEEKKAKEKKATRLFGLTGWVVHDAPTSTSFACGAAAIAAVVGLVIATRRVRGTYRALGQGPFITVTDEEMLQEPGSARELIQDGAE
jgi:hypothetical protein